jgi:integrase
MRPIRASKGFAYESRGRFYARITVAAQTREEVSLPWCTLLDAARSRAHALQSLVNRLREAGEGSWIEKVLELGAPADEIKLAELSGYVDEIVKGKIVKADNQAGPVTFKKFAERWTSGELAAVYPDHIETKASVDDDIERLTKHVYPHVGGVALVTFAREHADCVMAKLPPALGRGTRRQVAQLINRVLNLAAFTSAIKASPLPRGWLPKAPRPESIAKESLLPSEEAKLLAGRNAKGEVVVPLAYRVAYAFLHREGMRKGEAAHLTWGDVDLAKGLVSLDENKTDRPRSWVLDPGVAKVLAAWKKVCGKPASSAPVFREVAWDKLAPAYRTHCEEVGVTRARLFQAKANKLRLRAHDMRAFFITAGVFAGRDVLWITDRSGHTTLGMLRRYERDVRRWRELGEGAPVDAYAAIPELPDTNVSANVSAGGPTGGARKVANPSKVHGRGVEPLRLAAAEPKSAASASFATRAVSLRGIPGLILVGGSVPASSGMSACSGPSSPRFQVRALRR